MAITKEKKREIVKDLEAKLVAAESVVFVNFHGLTVAAATELRKALRAAQVGLTVAKKTLLRRALESQKIPGDLPPLEGEIAVAFGSDPISPARGIHEFDKTHKDVLKIVGGVYEGKFAPAALMLELATIPSREILLGKLVNLLNSPIQRLVMAVDQIAKSRN